MVSHQLDSPFRIERSDSILSSVELVGSNNWGQQQLPQFKAQRILEIDELKSVPGVPTSHPFIERVIGTTRREYLDHLIFFGSRDLQNKLDHFQEYYNNHRCHSSLNMKSPRRMAEENFTAKNVVLMDHYRWESRCNGLYQLPVAA